MDWSVLPVGDIRRIVATVCNKTKSHGLPFPDYDTFVDVIGWKDRQLYYDCQHVHFMYMGKWAGWWELSWDVFEHDCDLYPIQLVVINLIDGSAEYDEKRHTHFASLLADLKLFKSSSEAKKNGWNKPIERGDFFFKKKTYILRVR